MKTFHSSCFQSCDTSKVSGELSFSFYKLSWNIFSREFCLLFPISSAEKTLLEINFEDIFRRALWGIFKISWQNFGENEIVFAQDFSVVFLPKKLFILGLQMSTLELFIVFYAHWKINFFFVAKSRD